MNAQDQRQLESERDFLQQEIERLPSHALLTKSSAQSRMKVVEELLSSQGNRPRPLKALLTFGGRPVVGNYGIHAEFGSKATSAFNEAVVSVGAALLGPLAATGPLPNRDRIQLLITSTAIGSFGFELEEHRPSQELFDDETIAAQALDWTRELLESSVHGTDDELADAVAGINPRSVEAVRAFVELLASNDAVCTLVADKQTFRFRDGDDVHCSLDRLSRDNLVEKEATLFGEFQGVLPHGRTFEFKVAANDEVVRGRVGPEIDDPDRINRHLHEPVDIDVQLTQVGTGKPRYQLLKLPEWNSPRRADDD